MKFNLSSGTRTKPLQLSRGSRSIRLATPICFEDTVPWLCRSLAWNRGEKQADVFINLSNDGWMNTSDRARLHQVQIARFRCIENRLPMVRVVNTGVSIHIDSCGRLVGRIGAGDYGSPHTTGSLVATVQFDSRTPIFGVVGDVVGWVAMGFRCLILLLTFRRSELQSSRT